MVESPYINDQNHIYFDNNNRKFCCEKIGYTIQFELTNISMDYLFQIISNLPDIDIKDKAKRKTLTLGKCIRHVSMDKIIHLMNLAYKKITIRFDDSILEEVMASDQEFLKQIVEPEQYDTNTDHEYVIIKMAMMNYS